DAIQIIQRRRLRHRLKLEIADPCQVWMHRVDALAGVFIRGDQLQIDLRMKQQDTQQLTSSVARSSYDSCFDHFLSLTFSTSNWLKSESGRLLLCPGVQLFPNQFCEKLAAIHCVCRIEAQLTLYVILAHLRIGDRPGNNIDFHSVTSQ